MFHQHIGLRIVVHKQTYKRLPQFADFIYHNFHFVVQIAFMQMEIRGMKPYIYNAQLCILPEDIRHYAQQSISDWKDIYIPECDGCVLKGQCAGLFEANRQSHSAYIKKTEDISPDISIR